MSAYRCGCPSHSFPQIGLRNPRQTLCPWRAISMDPHAEKESLGRKDGKSQNIRGCAVRLCPQWSSLKTSTQVTYRLSRLSLGTYVHTHIDVRSNI